MGGKQRTLHDLYVVGRALEIDDGKGAVEVWLQKISPAEHDICLAKGNAARARMLLELRNQDSDAYLTVLAETMEHDREVLVAYLVLEEQAKMTVSIEAELELGEDSPWGKDGYLAGLRELWVDRLEAQWAEDAEDPEAKRVLAEMRRFADEVDERVEAGMADVRLAYEAVPVEDLQQKAVETFMEQRISQAWLEEYHRQRIFYGTRLAEDHRRYYFAHVDDVSTLPDEVRKTLMSAYEAIEVQADQGKDSRRATPSSPSSASPGPAETAPSSGLAASTA